MGSLALTVKLGCFPVALISLLLEQLEARAGAGQEKPEALGAETLWSEVSLVPGVPREEGSAKAVGSVGLALGWLLLHAPFWVREKQDLGR